MLLRVAIQDVEKDALRHDHEDEHACNLGRAPDDLQELADERLEELEDLQEAEELKVDHKDDEDLNDVQG